MGAVVGAGALLLSQVEVLLELVGVVAAGRFLTTRLLFAQDREQTINEVKYVGVVWVGGVVGGVLCGWGVSWSKHVCVVVAVYSYVVLSCVASTPVSLRFPYLCMIVHVYHRLPSHFTGSWWRRRFVWERQVRT